MAWDHLSINKPHLVYLILGGFTSLFMLCSSIIKERLYIGEATVATLCGIIFGPHAADLIDPGSWGNTDQITLEFSRLVLVVQCFAVGVELPKYYMERHWRSVVFLLVPVMTFGWLITSLFIWGLFTPHVNWLDSLCLAACVTATDPVLASSVVGKGKFAKRVPKHLRDILSAESGCNDGMAFPFIYLALYIIKYKGEPHEVALHWFCYTILYECIFGAVYGVAVGYIARRAIRFAHERRYIDRESLLVFYFVLGLFCAGSGSLLGMDDLLIGFACGVGFSNDGWFQEETEKEQVSNVIDLLINLAFFVYFGTIIPWKSYNTGFLGLDVWRLVVLAILVVFFRRIPIMMALKPLIPDVETWREALFAGHFGPIGVGAIFVAILARAELEHPGTGSTTPLAVVPQPPFEHANIIDMIWPITTFLVITSIVVHGSSVAVFTLGKHINTLSLSMSYSKAVEEPGGWLDRLPRIQSRSRSQGLSIQSENSIDNEKSAGIPQALLAQGVPARGAFLRRQKASDEPTQNQTSSKHKKSRSKGWDGHGPGGPVSDSAIKPISSRGHDSPAWRSDSDTLAMKSNSPPSSEEEKKEEEFGESPSRDEEAPEVFEEGDQTVYEDKEGNVLAVEESHEDDQATREESERREGHQLMHQEGADHNKGVAVTADEHEPASEQFIERIKSVESESRQRAEKAAEAKPQQNSERPERPGQMWREGVRKMSTLGMIPKRDPEKKEKAEKAEQTRKQSAQPARAYQYGNTIILEDEDGEVIKKYEIPAPDRKQSTAQAQHDTSKNRIGQMSKMLGLGPREGKAQAIQEQTGAPSTANDSSVSPPPQEGAQRRASIPDIENTDEDQLLRFTTGGRRMSKVEFIEEIQNMNPKRRAQAVETSNAPENVKREARREAREQANLASNARSTEVPVVREEPEEEETQAAIERVHSHDSRELKLIESHGGEVPIHNISRDLRAYQLQSGDGETAAERRRRMHVSQPAPEEDSDDDGTDRIPPTAQAGSSTSHQRNLSENVETAAEKRRREGALGIHRNQEEESDSEDDDQPRQIRFADQNQPPPPPQPQPQTQPAPRPSTLRWGTNKGR